MAKNVIPSLPWSFGWHANIDELRITKANGPVGYSATFHPWRGCILYIMKLIFLLCLSLLYLQGISLAKGNPVFISAEATEEYEAAFGDRSGDPILYHLIKGEFYPGGRRDDSLQEFELQDLASQLIQGLKQNGYEYTFDKTKGDLLIFFTWGATDPPPDLQDLWNLNSEEELLEYYGTDPNDPEINQDWVRGIQVEARTQGAPGRANIAHLLGYQKFLNRTDMMPVDQLALHEELRRDRYFVTLHAFDYQEFVATKTLKLHWVTRFSVDSSGYQFPEALSDLVLAADDYFGKHSDDFISLRPRDLGKAEMGELEDIEEQP